MSARESNTSTAPPLSGLVLASGDHAILVKKVLESYGFVVTSAADAGVAQELCAHRRFDLGVYDQDVHGALDFANSSFSSRPRVAVGLLQAKGPAQVPGRLHFVVHKPFSSDLLRKTVKATYGPIAADRRESFRQNVSIEASECNMLHRTELRTISGVRLVNISQTGLCLQAAEMLPQGATIEVNFAIPQSRIAVRLLGTVIWAHASGRAGVKFTSLDSAEQGKLEEWLEFALPDFKAPKTFGDDDTGDRRKCR